MSDWDKKRRLERSRSYRTLGNTAAKTWYNCTCVKCGYNYMTDVPPENIPGAMSTEGFLCESCRPNSGRKETAFSPPPPSLQISIEETLRAKK